MAAEGSSAPGMQFTKAQPACEDQLEALLYSLLTLSPSFFLLRILGTSTVVVKYLLSFLIKSLFFTSFKYPLLSFLFFGNDLSIKLLCVRGFGYVY